MTEAKDLEIEISTDNVRALCEIGFDMGVEAARAAIEGEGREAWRGEITNPFRRGSTVVEQIKRVEADAAANARAHSVPVVREPKSDLLYCECEQGTHCGRKPAGNFMLSGWPDSLILCEACEASDHAH